MDFKTLSTQIPLFGLIGGIALFWNHVKDFLIKIFRLFVKKRVISSFLAESFYFELKKDSLVFNFDDYGLNYDSLFFKKENRFVPCLFKLYNIEIFLYKKFIPVIIIALNNSEFSVSYLKYTFNFEKYVEKALEKYGKENYVEKDRNNFYEGRFRIETIIGHGLKKYGNFIPDKLQGDSNNSKGGDVTSSPNKIVFNNIFRLDQCVKNKMGRRFFGISDKIEEYSVFAIIPEKDDKYQFTECGKYVLEQVKKWLISRQWYEERGINWRRGICLHSSTGMGKSSLILEIAKKCGIPIYIFDLSSMDNEEFIEKIDNLEKSSGIILFEDLDSIYDKRVNLTKTNNFGGLSFECFINKLSGVNSIKNKFIFITTNYIEKLDSALLRPGRIDQIIEIVSLNLEEKRKMAEIFLGEENKELIEKCLIEGANDSTAVYENRLTEESLKLIWK